MRPRALTTTTNTTHNPPFFYIHESSQSVELTFIRSIADGGQPLTERI